MGATKMDREAAERFVAAWRASWCKVTQSLRILPTMHRCAALWR